ncbi:nitroreductase/quinone reductase family protein [Microbacterium sp. E-13]|uniref:nitroreductase/quinone reductase family protein n=1 Tax=Microbacterium sp. E-13 TaxID=3404048 RepID=UPI003CEF0544
MDAAITNALSLTAASTVEQRTVDITTSGARSQQPRRIEIWFHNIDGAVYLTGTPGARSWYANLRANPRFTFHLKHDVQADLPATATPVTDSRQRSAVLRAILEGIDAFYAGRASRPAFAPLEEWISSSPLVRVAFD